MPANPHIERHEQHLADASLPDIPFHAGPLFNGHDDYETPSMADRKHLFVTFSRWRGTCHSRMRRSQPLIWQKHDWFTETDADEPCWHHEIQ